MESSSSTNTHMKRKMTAIIGGTILAIIGATMPASATVVNTNGQLFFAAPVAIGANVVQAKTVRNQLQQVAPATTKKLLVKEASSKNVYLAGVHRSGRGTRYGRTGRG